jgi:acyl carrier protein
MRAEALAETRDVERRIHEIFRRQLHVEVPSSETDLFASGALDSLAFVDLLVALSDEFGREIALDQLEIEEFRTIGAVARFLAGRRELAS